MKLSDITHPTSARIIREQGGDEDRDGANIWGKVGDLAGTHGGSKYAGGKTPSGSHGDAPWLRRSDTFLHQLRSVSGVSAVSRRMERLTEVIDDPNVQEAALP